MNLWNLNYWKTGEYQVVKENLDALTRNHVAVNPRVAVHSDYFVALKKLKPNQVKVCIVGQDPYPNPEHATGIAFSIPPGIKYYPPTLRNIFDEYKRDLHYDDPPSGDLTRWVDQGVLLWNAFPVCEANRPGSYHWPELELLTQEIILTLDEQHIVFAFLGNSAKAFSRFVCKSKLFMTSHPSPRGVDHGFKGSRMFSTINGLLCELGKQPINWRL